METGTGLQLELAWGFKLEDSYHIIYEIKLFSASTFSNVEIIQVLFSEIEENFHMKYACIFWKLAILKSEKNVFPVISVIK